MGHSRDYTKIFLSCLSLLFLGPLFYCLFLLIQESYPALSHFGLGFFTHQNWSPNTLQFALLPFFFGTLITSFLSLLLAGPVGIWVALYLETAAPHVIKRPLLTFVEVLAAIPSITYGLWGLFYMVPFVQHYLGPVLSKIFFFLPFFQGPNLGISILSASLVLALMILPTIASLSREIFKQTSYDLKNAALSLGATRWEMCSLVYLGGNSKGLVAATLLGLGRSLGETMAVSLVIGNSPKITSSLLSAGATMASVIANEYGEADLGLHGASLTLVGLCLFLVTFGANIFIKGILQSLKKLGMLQ